MSRRLWLAVLLLWCVWAVRSHTIMSMPVFVDESLHMMRAQVVYDFTDAKASILPAKLLLYYYLGLFDLQDVGGAWLSRQAVALFALPGAALTFALARMLFKRISVGFVAMFLYASTPFLVFFERMALADSFAMVFALALAVVSIRLARHPNRSNAILTGFALGVALLAKLTTLPLALLPPLAVWLFGNWKWPQMQQYMVTVGIVAGMLLLPSALYMTYQELNPPDNKVESVEQDLFVPESNNRLDQVRHNIETYIEATRAMFSDALLVLLLAAIVWQGYHTWRPAIYLLAITGLTWGLVVVTAARPSTRYLVLGVPSMIIVVAAGLDGLVQGVRTTQHVGYYVAGVMALVFLAVWLGYSGTFLVRAWDDPYELPLADRDIWEYYQNSASGYGLREAASDLPELSLIDDRIPIVGFVGGCHILRWYLPAESQVELACPYFRWSVEQAPETLAEWRARIRDDGVWYVLADRDQPMDLCELNVQWDELAVYERPHDGIPLKLFRVTVVEDDAICLIPW